MYVRLSARPRVLSRDSDWTKWRLFTKLCISMRVSEFWGFNGPTKIKLQIKLATTCNENEQQEGTKSNAEI